MTARGKSKVNPREAEVIVEEIAGVVEEASAAEGRCGQWGYILIGADQALHIQSF